MTNKIDTDLTAAYLREVQRQAEKANEQIDLLNATVERLTKDKEFYITQCQELDRKLATVTELNTRIAAKQEQFDLGRVAALEWHPASEVPDNNERCIVRTREGATFMYEPINGKWDKIVEKWMHIPT